MQRLLSLNVAMQHFTFVMADAMRDSPPERFSPVSSGVIHILQ